MAMRGLSPCVTSSRANGQGETEGAATAPILFHPDSSAMPLDDALGNEQTESDTPAIVLFQLDEPVKNGFPECLRLYR